MNPKPQRTLTIENEGVRFSLSPSSHSWLLEDKRVGVSWGSPNGSGPWVNLLHGDGRIPVSLSRVEEVDGGLRCRFVRQGGKDSQFALVFRLVNESLQVYIVPDHLVCPAVELFSSGIEASADENGEVLLPIRMGLWVPAQGKRIFDKTFGTYEYEGLHLGMAAIFKKGAGLMISWQDPYVKLGLSRRFAEHAPELRMRFEMTGSARSIELRCLPKGDLTSLASAYRQRAEQLGYRLPWSEKFKRMSLRQQQAAQKLFGACNFKLWTALARRIDEHMQEQSVDIHWTFDEAAQIAEHLKRDLQIDDVLFHLGGWTRYGYDCRHPDIMPANPECGGNEGLIDCARRVQKQGYLFCLHDNYQDMYRDAPSWDEAYLQKQADGTPTVGGVWLGGQAYYTCAREAVRLAQRPENLPEVAAVIQPDGYFIDTTYAVGPQECFDPRHPLTKQQDIEWKAKLSDDARNLFGLFGSECGREWAVPHADFFEGLVSVSGKYYHMIEPEELDARVVPFFDMVFHDCIAVHGKYGYQPEQMAEQVIHHASTGRTLYYHSVAPHLYWHDPAGQDEVAPPDGLKDPALYTRSVGGWAEGFCLWDRFIKNTQEILGPINKRTSMALIDQYEFLDSARTIRRTVFNNGITVVVNGSSENFSLHSNVGGEVILPPYGLIAEAEDFTAFVALAWGGLSYDSPTLFTLTSLDGKPLSDSTRVRVYHGFGSTVLNWNQTQCVVRREEVLTR